MGMERPPIDWQAWVREVLEGGGWTPSLGWSFLEEGFPSVAMEAARRLDAPDGVFAALAFVDALDQWRWEELIPASEALAVEIEEERRWISPEVVLEGGVVARLLTGRPTEAEQFFQRLEALSGRPPWDFRTQLLKAHLDQALSPR
jgi:hypothetical protein